MKKFLELIPAALIVPFWIVGFLYAILIPETIYYALGIYLDLWFPVLQTFWGYIIVGILFLIPLLNFALGGLLVFQSFAVLLKFIFGSYDPSLHGFVTMYPACMLALAILASFLDRD